MPGWIARKSGLVACLGVLALGASGAARSAEPEAPAAAVQDPYPPAARALNLPGRATLNCTATADGGVHDCAVAGEDPAGWGFGKGALKIAPTINVGPGAPERPVQTPVRFRLEAGDVPNPQIATPGFAIPEDQIVWTRRPVAEDYAATYPADALRRNRPVSVAFACRVLTAGDLGACVVLSQKNGGDNVLGIVGYMAGKYRMEPKLRDGRAAENGVATIRLNWSAED